MNIDDLTNTPFRVLNCIDFNTVRPPGIDEPPEDMFRFDAGNLKLPPDLSQSLVACCDALHFAFFMAFIARRGDEMPTDDRWRLIVGVARGLHGRLTLANEAVNTVEPEFIAARAKLPPLAGAACTHRLCLSLSGKVEDYSAVLILDEDKGKLVKRWRGVRPLLADLPPMDVEGLREGMKAEAVLAAQARKAALSTPGPAQAGTLVAAPCQAPQAQPTPGTAAEPSDANTHGRETMKPEAHAVQREEAEKLAQRILDREPEFARATQREWASRIGCSTGTVGNLPAWKKVMERRRRELARRPKAVSLTDRLAATTPLAGAGVQSEVLERLMAESNAENASDPSPLDPDSPDNPRRARQRKQV